METFKQGQTSEIPASEYGGKAANLSELVNAGFNVPPGFVFSADEVQDVADAATAAHDVVTQFKNFCLSPMIGDYCDGYPVAVRSSAIGEDGAGFSFAGQYDTILNLFTVEDVIKAIQEVAASASNDRVQAYQEANNLEASGVGVIVQAMVRPASAGVMFTAEPVESDPSLIAIEAVQGLGDKMVSGQASPDFHLLDKITGATVESTCINDPVLGRTEINALYEAGVAIERHYGCPQDIEWAFGLGSDGEVGLFILQTRPITTL